MMEASVPLNEPSQGDVRIRHDIAPGDLGEVVRMHGVIYAQEFGWNHAFEAYVAEGIARFGQTMDPATGRLWLAEIDRRLVGSIAIVRRDARVAQLRWFLVHPDARGRGLGRRLLQDAVDFARSCRYTSVMLETVAGLDAAAALYRDAGFALAHEAPVTRWGTSLLEQIHELSLAAT